MPRAKTARPPRPPGVCEAHRDEVLAWTLAGMSTRMIGERLGCHYSTVAEWLARRDVAAEVDAGRQAIMQNALRAATSASVPALNTLIQCLNAPDASWRDKVMAANSILRMLSLDRIAESMDHQALATLVSGREALGAKIEAMETRLREAPALTVVPAEAR